ncbi:hypothetical protein Syun_010313 [Stephania yunnanensis]|uniref:Uncharacterized protein n=1 Tax=Stephania yunnanensis TaxID=152371 RepID=A0AAP0PRI9_9MAGN
MERSIVEPKMKSSLSDFIFCCGRGVEPPPPPPQIHPNISPAPPRAFIDEPSLNRKRARMVGWMPSLKSISEDLAVLPIRSVHDGKSCKLVHRKANTVNNKAKPHQLKRPSSSGQSFNEYRPAPNPISTMVMAFPPTTLLF